MAEDSDFDVERIIGHRLGSDGGSEYLIRWSGYGQESDSWEPEDNINQKSIINDYLKANPVSGTRVTAKYTSKTTGKSVTIKPQIKYHPDAVNGKCVNGDAQDAQNQGVFHLTINGQTQTVTFPLHPFVQPEEDSSNS